MILPLAQDAVAALRSLRAAFPIQPLALVGAAALGCRIPMKWRRTEDLDLVLAVLEGKHLKAFWFVMSQPLPPVRAVDRHGNSRAARPGDSIG